MLYSAGLAENIHFSILLQSFFSSLFIIWQSLLAQQTSKSPQMDIRLLPASASTNQSKLGTELSWSIEDFEELKQQKRRKHSQNALTQRYGLRIDHCPDGGEPELDILNGQVKLCQLDDECRPSYKCRNIIGLTHFGKQMRYCCPTKTTACTEKPKLELVVPGQCRPLKIFYYFDVDQLSCVKSKMAQCEDFGKNRFASMLECRTKCETTACELGESILLHNGSFDQPFLCQSDEDCPVGYNCRQDRIFRRSVCCGFLDFEPCPLGFHSFTVPFSGRPKTCVSSDTRDECPTDYVCTQNQIDQEHYCCTVEKGVCPEGHQAYIHPLTDGTIKCNLRGYESTTACPPGYACLAAVFGSSWGFCCSQAVVASCPEDSYPQINPITNQPQRCELTQTHTCAKGFICESDSVSHLGFCCSIPRKNPKKKLPLQELVPRKKTRQLLTTTIEPEEEVGEEEGEKEEDEKNGSSGSAGGDVLTTSTTEETPQKLVVPTVTSSLVMPTAEKIGMQKEHLKRKSKLQVKVKKKNNKGRGKRKGERKGKRSSSKWKKAKNWMKTKEENPWERDSKEPGSDASSSSDERSMERHELNELSTKLDRFITGIRRRTHLPKGHGHRPRPRIWRLKKGKGRVQKLIPAPVRGSGRAEQEEEEEEEREKEENGSREEDEREELGSRRSEQKKRRPANRPKCPEDHRPMTYPGTRWTYLECIPERRKRTRKGGKRQRRIDENDEEEEEEKSANRDENGEEEAEEADEGEGEGEELSGVCPKPAICLRARNDPFERSLCCVKRNDDNDDDNNEEEGDNEDAERRGDEEEEEDGEESKGNGGNEGVKRRMGEKDKQEPSEEQLEERVDREEGEMEKRKKSGRGELGAEGRQAITTKRTGVVPEEGGQKAAQISVPMQPTTITTTTAVSTRSSSSLATTRTAATKKAVKQPFNLLVVEKSNDLACPHLIANRTCTPGSTKDCREPGFFCQFNKDKLQFVCCSKN